METKTIEFTNWSGQYSSRPMIYAIPETPQDLQQIILDTERFPSPVVAIGSGHSNSGCNVVNGGTAVYMKKFRHFNEPQNDEITVGAGLQLIDVHRFLAQRQLQLPFTPEIGNATIGSVACCCLKDAAIGKSSGIATTMVKAIKYFDAKGTSLVAKKGDEQWQVLTSGHGLMGIIYEVTLDVMPMTVVIQNYVPLNVGDHDWENIYWRALRENDGIFGLLNATTGKLILETRNFDKQAGKPGAVENIYNSLDRNIFRYFNPFVGALERNWWSRWVRNAALAGFGFFKFSFKNGRRTYKNLKPIDYSDHYPYRWDFNFWAYPVATFPTVVLPAFIKFLKGYKIQNPGFDERGLMACYRIRQENNALLSPSFDEERMTIDPVRPVTKNKRLMEAWDKFCFAYNEFAVSYGGKCTFNQTKVLSRTQAEQAFGEKWGQFKKAREIADPQNRFLSGYFKSLLYGQ
jgi:hypothetical protein